MAVARDVTNTASLVPSTANTSFSNNSSLTVAAGDTALAIILLYEGNPGAITAPTWNAASSTPIGTTVNNGTGIYQAAFGLVSPAVGVHLTFAASWTNSVPYGYIFIPCSGSDTSSFANAFRNFNSSTGADISAGASLTISDGSSSNLDIDFIQWNGGSATLTAGPTEILGGNQVGVANVFDAAQHTGQATDTYTWTGGLARAWAQLGFSIMAPSGGPAPIVGARLVMM